jgi:phage shock protein PspC (stress-responsive transcriptional regulator)
MTWQEIEFFDPHTEPPTAPTAQPRLPRANRRWVRALLAPAAWVAAAALATLTPFLPIYRIGVPQGLSERPIVYHVDGWGRQRPGPITFSGHGIRFGILLVACAGILLAAAAWGVWRAARQRPSDPSHPLDWLSVAGTATLAGVMGGYAAYLDADFSTVRAANRQRSDFQSNGSGSVGASPVLHAHIGAGLWLGVAASVCAALGTVAYLWRRRPVPREPDAGPASVLPDREIADLDGAELLD